MSWFFSKIYDRIMRGVEEEHIIEWRQEALRNVTGEVLEIGAGTGANLDLYSQNLKRLVLIEPNKHMRSILEKKVMLSKQRAKILRAKAGQLPFEDNSFDWVVSTLVLCSVPSLNNALKEIHRVLRKGGKIAFVEHVLDLEDLDNQKRQKRWQPYWGALTSHCQVIQNTETVMEKSGFDITNLKRGRMNIGPRIIRPMIYGTAIAIEPLPTTNASGLGDGGNAVPSETPCPPKPSRIE